MNIVLFTTAVFFLDKKSTQRNIQAIANLDNVLYARSASAGFPLADMLPRNWSPDSFRKLPARFLALEPQLPDCILVEYYHNQNNTTVAFSCQDFF